MNINDLCKESHDRAVRKGFYETPPTIEQRLCLIHSEVSEALEAYREGKLDTRLNEKGKPEGFWSEIADVIIRCCDLAGRNGVDLAKEIRLKSDYNETRPHKHGKAF